MTQDQHETPRNSALGIIASSETSIAASKSVLMGFIQGMTIRGGASGTERWIERPRSNGHLTASAWVEENKASLAEFENKWIAVAGGHVLVSNEDFSEVRAFLDRESIPNALVTFVEDSGERRLFID